MKLQNGYQIIYSVKDKHGVEHFYAGKGTKPSKKDDVMVMVASGKVVYGGEKDEEVVIADGVTTEELLNITANGEYNIANYQKVVVEVPGEEPTGSIDITSNGEHNVAGKAIANVNVPIPEGYIQPEGSLDITANADNIDVTNKATVNVNVPNPSTGTKNITTNGTYNVTNFASANVNVPIPAIIDFSNNSYITGYMGDPLSYDSFEIFNDSISVNLFAESQISLSEVDSECSNLEEVIYQALNDSFTVQGSVLPVLATKSVHFGASIYIHASTWPYWTEHYEVLMEAFQNLPGMGQNNVYDIAGHELGRTELYLDTNS